jgi:archaemetzincin
MHEAGHNLGLRHCKNTDCVMQDAAEKISTIDRVERALCEQCKKQIR